MLSAELDALAESARGGSRRALEQLVAEIQGPLYQLALRFLGHPADARDATQEILILIITRLGSFRGESALMTWAHRIAVRYVLRRRSRFRAVSFESLASDDLGQPENVVAPETLASADERLLEEEVFLGCTQAMLQALDGPHRIAFVLGGILELESRDAAAALGISEAAYRKRVSRARATLDTFMTQHCGVANPESRCRCTFQINHNVARGRLSPRELRFAVPVARTSLEALRARSELGHVRRSLELYRAQPSFLPREDFAVHLRELITQASSLSS